MKARPPVSKTIEVISYLVLVSALTAEALSMRFNLGLALLPGAVIFGWSQIGGL